MALQLLNQNYILDKSVNFVTVCRGNVVTILTPTLIEVNQIISKRFFDTLSIFIQTLKSLKSERIDFENRTI